MWTEAKPATHWHNSTAQTKKQKHEHGDKKYNQNDKKRQEQDENDAASVQR